MKNMKANRIIPQVNENTNFDQWLSEFETNLKKEGYRKYYQRYRLSDFAYWKVIKKDNEELYMIGILFYDFKGHTDNRIRIDYHCRVCNSKCEMTTSKDVDVQDFEKFAEKFYQLMKKTLKL